VAKETMNTAQLKKNVGQDLLLRPHVLTVHYVPRLIARAAFVPGVDPMTERRLLKTDHRWRLMAVTREGVTLHCLYTNHEITLGADNVRELRTPHFLMLKCQLTLDGDRVHVEPIA
jgi:hypothetical protein